MTCSIGTEPRRASFGLWRVIGGRAAGFTLIEILVVVAIIALLVAILLPSLLKAREQATGAVCSTNLHQIMLGMHEYVAENKVLPGNGSVLGNSWFEAGKPGGGPVPSGTANWKPSDSWLGLPEDPKQFNNPAVAGDQQLLWDFLAATVPQNGSLFRYVRNERAYLCPKDHKGTPEPENPAGGGGNGRFSYTMMGPLGFRPPERSTSFTYVADFQQIAGPYTPIVTIKAGTRVVWTMSKMMTFAEEHPWNNTNHGYVDDSFAFDSYLAFRHHTTPQGGMGMFAFLDGHAEGKRYPYFIPVPGTTPPRVDKFQGVDLLNEYKIPYDWQGNAGGGANASLFIEHFPYPYR